jgi:hypothetical protein
MALKPVSLATNTIFPSIPCRGTNTCNLQITHEQFANLMVTMLAVGTDAVLVLGAGGTDAPVVVPVTLAVLKVLRGGGPAAQAEATAIATEAGVLAPRIGATGSVGENWLSTQGGPGGVYQKQFPTTLGLRVVDAVLSDGAHEAKVGYQYLSPNIATQIAKDAESKQEL